MKPFSISSLSKCKFEFVKSVRCYHNLAPGVIIVCLFTHLFRWNHVLKATLLKYFFTDNDYNNNINYVAKIFVKFGCHKIYRSEYRAINICQMT